MVIKRNWENALIQRVGVCIDKKAPGRLKNLKVPPDFQGIQFQVRINRSFFKKTG